MQEEQTFSFCEKCGAKIFNGAEICANCGCETRMAMQRRNAIEKKQKNKKRIIITIAIIAFLAIAFIAGIFVRNYIRVEQIKDKLANNKFDYVRVGYNTYTEKHYEFDSDANCTYYAYYYVESTTNSYEDRESEYEYTRDYDVVFKNGKVFLEFGSDTFEVQFNSYGDIDSLYDITFEHVYD